ncbi:MAG: sulfatase/phosphatase domain-containing protein, partial [Akkermansiaceae bacterium]
SGDIRTKFKSAKADAKKMGHVTNGPYRDGKGYPYEGGHRVPFVAKWPGKIAPGSTSANLVNLTDLFATTADILNQDLPENVAEDSLSLLPTLLGKPDAGKNRKAIFILGDGKDSSIAVCTGEWKLIVRYDEARKQTYELYNLHQDPGESTELSAKHPEITQKLATALEKAESNGRTR